MLFAINSKKLELPKMKINIPVKNRFLLLCSNFLIGVTKCYFVNVSPIAVAVNFNLLQVRVNPIYHHMFESIY